MELRITSKSAVNTKHPDYDVYALSWARVRDCLNGEDTVKRKTTDYLPRPAGMDGKYKAAYDAYIERAHFPLITAYALSGALGVITTKLPEFNVPDKLSYILKEATKDGRSIQQLFLDCMIEVFQTGRVPLLVDVIDEKNEFRFVQYTAESFINWKTSQLKSEQSLILATLAESLPATEDLFSHDTLEVFRVLSLDADGNYSSSVYGAKTEYTDMFRTPTFMGKYYPEVPLIVAGSINNSYDLQPIPLISVANCSIQIYRKEADLANSEFLSCNPTLVLTGASNDDNLPNVVGSSVMIVIPNEASRVFYTRTDTFALTHVKAHIESLYEEAIRHGVAILDARKGVEAAEALRIRQATQSASIYSIYLAVLNAIKQGLVIMCKWAGYNEEEVILDAPSSLTYGIPDPAVLKQIVEGFAMNVVPLNVIHRYLVSSGLIDQTISYTEYLEMLFEQKTLLDSNTDKDKPTTTKKEETALINDNTKQKDKPEIQTSKSTVEEVSGAEDKLV